MKPPPHAGDRQTATLRNWFHAGGRLHGQVYGHPDPRLPDGEPVTTSRVVEIDEHAGWAKTLNTDYTLEGPPRWTEAK